DGIVPLNSARMSDKITNSANVTTMAGFDHQALSFRIPSNTTQAQNFFSTIVTLINGFIF
ncbi:MAG: hypothetical protein K8R21_00935, partial [Leptospira sp.]|nr:hypothetical protein [Leptospira sp.]